MDESELVDRRREAAELRRLQAEPPKLAIVAGRRRVGKSYLLSAALRGPRLVSFQADEQPLNGQLALLAAEAGSLLPGNPRLTFATWEEALRFFDAQASLAPVTLVLDEFQYLCRSEPALPTMIMRWWDRWQRERRPITLIVCGSALSFMEGLISSTGAFFGRADWRPLLQPLGFRENAAFAAPSTTREQLIVRYGVLGGTPQYQVWAGARPIPRLIKEVILATGAPLYEEPLNLLRGEDDIRQPGTYFSILQSIAGSDTQPSAIASRVQMSMAQVSQLLRRLRDLGYVEEVAPAQIDGVGGGRPYWRIADPFFNFWFRYVFPKRSRLERGLVDDAYAAIETDLPNYIGRNVFEACCREWTASFSNLAGAAETVGSWWPRKSTTEIDVVAMARGRCLLLGSCKWSRNAGPEVLDQLYEQRALLATAAPRAQLAIFARGFQAKLQQRAKDENVWLVSPDDLFGDGARFQTS